MFGNYDFHKASIWQANLECRFGHSNLERLCRLPRKHFILGLCVRRFTRGHVCVVLAIMACNSPR